jgi:RimJ/RimL family protein N-acetyltransferase
MLYFEKLPGSHIYLSPMNPGDLDLYTKWLNDREVALWLSLYPKLISLPAEQKTLEHLATEGYIFAIILRETGQCIGNISLTHIHDTYRQATLGIFIGETEHRSKGYGAEAIRLLLNYGFHTLNLHTVQLYVNSKNARAIACYKKCGFREVGRRREAIFMDGRYVDRVVMDILDREFDAQ